MVEPSGVRVLATSSTSAPDRPYAAVLTRATFSSVPDLEQALGWAAPGGCLIAWRTDPTGRPGADLHRYEIQGQARLLEVWRR